MVNSAIGALLPIGVLLSRVSRVMRFTSLTDQRIDRIEIAWRCGLSASRHLPNRLKFEAVSYLRSRVLGAFRSPLAPPHRPHSPGPNMVST